MDTNQNDEIEIDLKELFKVIKNKILIILLVGLIGASIAGLYSGVVLKPTYISSTMLYVFNKTTTITSLADLQLGSQLTKDYKVLVTSRPVIKKVIENLSLNMDYEQMCSLITINNPVDTRILTISVVHGDPQMAKIIADEVAAVSVDRIAEIMNMDPPNIVEEAYLPLKKTGPSIKKYTMLGGGAGCLIAGFIVVLLYILNDSLKSSEDIEKYLGLNTLGIIPLDKNQKEKRVRRSKRKHR